MKRKLIGLTLVIMLACLLCPLSLEVSAADAAEDVFYISAGGRQLTVKMDDSEAARELKAMLATADLTVSMTRNSFEQYGSLGRNNGAGRRCAAV